jgi:transcription elongation factor Elf1
VSDPEGVSLSKLGLMAPDGLDCPEGGLHHVSESAVIIAAAHDGGMARCRKCGERVELRAIRELT